MEKKKYIIAISLVCLIIGYFVYNIIYNQYSYEWKEESTSVVGQYRLYIKNGFGKYVEGRVDITYLNDKKETVEITSDGVLYVKSIIKNVENPRK